MILSQSGCLDSFGARIGQRNCDEACWRSEESRLPPVHPGRRCLVTGRVGCVEHSLNFNSRASQEREREFSLSCRGGRVNPVRGHVRLVRWWEPSHQMEVAQRV